MTYFTASGTPTPAERAAPISARLLEPQWHFQREKANRTPSRCGSSVPLPPAGEPPPPAAVPNRSPRASPPPAARWRLRGLGLKRPAGSTPRRQSGHPPAGSTHSPGQGAQHRHEVPAEAAPGGGWRKGYPGAAGRCAALPRTDQNPSRLGRSRRSEPRARRRAALNGPGGAWPGHSSAHSPDVNFFMNGLGARRLRGEVWGCVSVCPRVPASGWRWPPRPGPSRRREVRSRCFTLGRGGVPPPGSAADRRGTHRRYPEHHRGWGWVSPSGSQTLPLRGDGGGGGRGHGQGRHVPRGGSGRPAPLLPAPSVPRTSGGSKS